MLLHRQAQPSAVQPRPVPQPNSAQPSTSVHQTSISVQPSPAHSSRHLAPYLSPYRLEECEHLFPDLEAGQRAVRHRRQPVGQHGKHVRLEEGQLEVLLPQLRHGRLQHRDLPRGRLAGLVQLAVLLGDGGGGLVHPRSALGKGKGRGLRHWSEDEPDAF